ncbi:MAG: DUF4105 domain-containing protein [Bacteroidales bacterium]|nr:DUF4105 domain-containing protein [Bacteroidales bacterium]
MKKFILFGIILVSGLQYCFSKNDVEISLLTCSSGSASYEAWGHSAIRLIDERNRIDIVYDFGRIDFNMPNFYWNFIKGKLRYGMGVQTSDNFFKNYQLENREVIEQKLNLSDDTKIKLVKELEYLYRPENRFYYYDFLDKNCTTQLRDLILSNIKTDNAKKDEPKTFRIQLNEFLNRRQWVKFGINLILGTSVDKEVDDYERMFLPYYLHSGLNNLRIAGNKIVISEREYNSIILSRKPLTSLLTPILVFSILLCLILIIKLQRLQFPILAIVGITGLLILVVSILTEHQDLKNNFNILWCNPLYLVSVILQLGNKTRLWYYLSVALQFMIVGMIFIWMTNIQGWVLAFLPIVFLLSIYNIRAIKKGYNILYK